jgi:hypothetical protein
MQLYSHVQGDEMIHNTEKDLTEIQETQGQMELVNSTCLPVACDHNEKRVLQEAGVIFDEPLQDDPIFCNAILPAGWSKRATNHSMWSELVDETGRVRATIFYKAAFYDRSAHLSIQ